MKSFGENLKRLRTGKGWTQLELGSKCNPAIGTSEISHFERGRGNPHYNKIVIFKRAIGCKFDDLFYGSIEELEALEKDIINE